MSLLTRPTTFDIDYLAYKLFCKEYKIVVLIESEADSLTKSDEDIGMVMEDIAENSRAISARLKEKTMLFTKIQANMDLLRYAKINLNEHQMDSFARFTRSSEKESLALSATLQKLDAGKDLSMVKNELLHNDADYNLIYDELKEIDTLQQEALASLNGMISQADNMLQLL